MGKQRHVHCKPLPSQRPLSEPSCNTSDHRVMPSSVLLTLDPCESFPEHESFPKHTSTRQLLGVHTYRDTLSVNASNLLASAINFHQLLSNAIIIPSQGLYNTTLESSSNRKQAAVPAPPLKSAEAHRESPPCTLQHYKSSVAAALQNLQQLPCCRLHCKPASAVDTGLFRPWHHYSKCYGYCCYPPYPTQTHSRSCMKGQDDISLPQCLTTGLAGSAAALPAAGSLLLVG